MVENQLTHLEEKKPLIMYENPIFIPETNFEKYKTKRVKIFYITKLI